MTPEQRERACEFIRRLRECIPCVVKRELEGKNSFRLGCPGIGCFGAVRYNIRGENARKYTVYAYKPFDDPEGRFTTKSSKPDTKQDWFYPFSPSNDDAIKYAIGVLKSASDLR